MNAVARHAVVALVVALAACGGPNHIAPNTPRHRHYERGPYADATRPAEAGSLWPDSGRGLFADFRASRVGDLVTIKIDESPRASGDAATGMERESSMSFGVNSLFGLTSALTRAYPDMDPTQLLSAVSNSSFEGTGETSRGSRARGSIAVRVREVMPNGDLFVEGTKVILINDEELHIYVSGLVRPEDIEQDNSVESHLIADAQVEFTGHGVLTSNQEQGWLSRLLSAINPF